MRVISVGKVVRIVGGELSGREGEFKFLIGFWHSAVEGGVSIDGKLYRVPMKWIESVEGETVIAQKQNRAQKMISLTVLNILR